MNPLLDLKLLFVTGKGGVGKTTVASALALLASQRGKRVLICEVDAKGDVAGFYETAPTTFHEREVLPGLFAMTMDTEASLREYLKLQLRIPVVGRIGPLAKAFDFVATAAPGVREILTVGKFCYEVRERHYDLVVVDAPASGHIIGQLAAPQAINSLVKVGLIRTQTDWLLEILSDPRATGLVAVCTPEEMPVNETIDLAARVRDETTVQLSAVVVNRVLPELFGRQEEAVFDALGSPGPLNRLNGLVGGRRPGARRRPSGRHHAAHPHHPPRPAAAGHRQCRTAALPPLPVHPLARSAHHPSGGGVPGRGAGLLMAERASHRGRTGRSAPPGPGDRPDRPVTTSSAGSGSMDGLLATKEIVIACGPGGVGKTTTAAAAGVMAAVRHGSKVLVLTVDPAKRLANALGLDGIGNTEHRVPDEAFRSAGLKPRGQLWVAMLDTKESWDALIRRHAPDKQTRDEILANPLYQNISGKFVQSHDYIAMERLYEIHSESDYDLIVVDTPPTRNALDFLDAPQRMADFFSSRLLRWLIVPYRSRLVNVATKPFYSIADRILGTEFLADISEFFILFQSMYDGFVERSESVGRLLSDRRTTFVVVSTLEAVPLREAEFFAEQLVSRRLHLGAIVLNKVLPDYLRGSEGTAVADAINERSDELSTLLAPELAAVDATMGDTDQIARVLGEVADSYLNFQVVALREMEERAMLSVVPDVLATVPFFDTDIFDLAGLVRLGEQIWD